MLDTQFARAYDQPVIRRDPIVTSEAEGKGLPESENFTAWLRRLFSIPVGIVARGLVRLGIGPNGVTIGGFLLTVGAAWLAGHGEFARAGFVYLVGTGLDGLDGAVARAGGKVTHFGALLDSTLDRYGEAAVLSALGYHLAAAGNVVGVALAFAGLFGSVMVSYMRARSEGLGVQNKVGLLTRVERVIVLSLALLTGWLMPGLWALAILTQVTVFQRLYTLHRATRPARGGNER